MAVMVTEKRPMAALAAPVAQPAGFYAGLHDGQTPLSADNGF
ncbi:hypothetical protein [Corticibacter populi]|nr:hypothetical protein [Corticibacter populi]